MATASVSTTSSSINYSTTAQQQQPPGFNKSRRDLTKILLVATAACLLTNANAFATGCSAAAILILKQATLFSTKNIKWGILSVTSFVVSLTCAIFLQAYEIVDEDKAYTMKIMLWLTAKFLRVFWGVTLGLFLLSTLTSSSPSVPAPMPESAPPDTSNIGSKNKSQ